MEAFRTWFSSLREGDQLDDQVINSLGSLLEWFLNLSQNQQYVVLAFVAVTIFVLLCVSKACYNIFFRVRRWYRRKRIPKNIDLHIDRD